MENQADLKAFDVVDKLSQNPFLTQTPNKFSVIFRVSASDNLELKSLTK